MRKTQVFSFLEMKDEDESGIVSRRGKRVVIEATIERLSIKIESSLRGIVSLTNLLKKTRLDL